MTTSRAPAGRPRSRRRAPPRAPQPAPRATGAAGAARAALPRNSADLDRALHGRGMEVTPVQVRARARCDEAIVAGARTGDGVALVDRLGAGGVGGEGDVVLDGRVAGVEADLDT